MKKKKNNVDRHSFAGKLGAAARWKDHEKKSTKLVRMFKDDYDFLANSSHGLGLPVIIMVHRCIQHIRDCHRIVILSSFSDH